MDTKYTQMCDARQGEKMAVNEPKNKKLADIYYNDVMNGGKVDRIADIIQDDFIFTIPTHPEVFRGPEGFRKEVSGLHGAFPDVHLDVHHLWCFDDLILGLWTGTGTHIGAEPLSTPAGPVPATGRPFVIQGVSWIRADGVLLRENLANEDTLRIVHSLGLADFSAVYRNADASLVRPLQMPVRSSIGVTGHALMADTIRFDHPLLSAQAVGSAQTTAFLDSYWSAFDQVEFRITQAKRGVDVNAYRWEFTATHTGDFFGVPASGNRIHHQGVTVSVLNSAGKVTSTYVNENLIVLMGQIAPQPSNSKGKSKK